MYIIIVQFHCILYDLYNISEVESGWSWVIVDSLRSENCSITERSLSRDFTERPLSPPL